MSFARGMTAGTAAARAAVANFQDVRNNARMNKLLAMQEAQAAREEELYVRQKEEWDATAPIRDKQRDLMLDEIETQKIQNAATRLGAEWSMSFMGGGDGEDVEPDPGVLESDGEYVTAPSQMMGPQLPAVVAVPRPPNRHGVVPVPRPPSPDRTFFEDAPMTPRYTAPLASPAVNPNLALPQIRGTPRDFDMLMNLLTRYSGMKPRDIPPDVIQRLQTDPGGVLRDRLKFLTSPDGSRPVMSRLP